VQTKYFVYGSITFIGNLTHDEFIKSRIHHVLGFKQHLIQTEKHKSQGGVMAQMNNYDIFPVFLFGV
jgi:hypothetical protein